MPVFRSGKGQAPAWCELEQFDIVRLQPGQTHSFTREGRKEKLIAAKGKCKVRIGREEKMLEHGTIVDLTEPGLNFEVTEVAEPVILTRMAGHWGDQVGGSGLFSVVNTDKTDNPGGPVRYEKTTTFDAHYHDCDEYWILLEGRGEAVSEGKHYQVGPGDCVATGRGFLHDFPKVEEPVLAVYFETTIEGEKRLGHLWPHTHGTPRPVAERV
ncbi:MAG: Cupin domain protein [candidate division BRC1 bacterium ADurb.BinA292]|nr:MAG: Cupin domain protein [candidate division BRC1 bacterium ADurb.BinA292]